MSPGHARSQKHDDVDQIDVIAYTPSTATLKQKPRFSIIKFIASLLFLSLVFALWFVFTARSVWVQIEPQADSLTLEGNWLRIKWKDHYLLPGGNVTIRAAKEGYYPLLESFELSDEASQQYQFNLVKLPGILRFEFDDAVDSAQIFVGDSHHLPSLDGELEVPAGNYKMRVESPRYQIYTTDLEVTGLGITQTIAVVLEPNWADVTVATLPVNAQVFVDDEKIGDAPGTFEIIAGEHQLSLRANGYKRWFKTLNLTAGQPVQLGDITLLKADGSVSVTTQPVSAAVSVNGQYKGMAPQTFKLPPGRSYTISASKVGFEKISRQVKVSSNEDLSLDWQLIALVGHITIVDAPPNATVWSRGAQIGRAGEHMVLPAVDHVLEVRAEGYATKSVSVLPKPKLAQDVSVALLTLQQARAAELKRKSTVKTADGQTLLLQRPKAFTMGASRRARGRRANETLRNVEQLPLYYIATHEVTNKHFKAFKPAHSSGSAFRVSLDGSDQPVVNVSWDDAARYCNWLSEQDSLPDAYAEVNGKMRPVRPRNIGYRLPTEAEWAWAARFSGGRQNTLYPWGEDLIPPEAYGNYADKSAEGLSSRILTEYDDGFAATSPVGEFKADAAGLYDLSGNVSEWMNDVYRVSAIETTVSGGAGNIPHVIRGSSWQHSRISELRPTYRDFSDQPRSDLGFRIGRTLE